MFFFLFRAKQENLIILVALLNSLSQLKGCFILHPNGFLRRRILYVLSIFEVVNALFYSVYSCGDQSIFSLFFVLIIYRLLATLAKNPMRQNIIQNACFCLKRLMRI